MNIIEKVIEYNHKLEENCDEDFVPYKIESKPLYSIKSEDGWIVHTAVQALGGVTNKELLPIYVELLNKYKLGEFYIKSNVMSNLKAFEKDAHYIFEQEK